MDDYQVPVVSERIGLNPAYTVDAAVKQFAMVREFVSKALVEDQDYGQIKGIKKPCLFKCGAEKLRMLFSLSVTFRRGECVEDWTGEHHGGEPLFHYSYICSVRDRSGNLLAECEGSCNSWEDKYRWRHTDRECPNCGAGTILKSKAEWGGGWYCNKGKGGCGAKFAADDPRILEQAVGRVPNPDPHTAINTYQKQAQKRALVGAILLACGVSGLFTQDVEDLRPAKESEGDLESVAEDVAQSPRPTSNGGKRETGASTTATDSPDQTINRWVGWFRGQAQLEQEALEAVLNKPRCEWGNEILQKFYTIATAAQAVKDHTERCAFIQRELRAYGAKINGAAEPEPEPPQEMNAEAETDRDQTPNYLHRTPSEQPELKGSVLSLVLQFHDLGISRNELEHFYGRCFSTVKPNQERMYWQGLLDALARLQNGETAEDVFGPEWAAMFDGQGVGR